MNTFCKTCIITVHLVLASALTAQATPSPALVISDHIIGTTPDSFFVIRTTTLNPPIYYQYFKRLEFVELSNRDGSIVDRCMLRETEYASDAGVDPETWTQTETQKPSCRVFDMLAKRRAGYMTPQSTGNEPAAFRLGAGGLEARTETSDDTASWSNVLSSKAILEWAAKTTSVPVSGIPWQTGADPSDNLNFVGIVEEAEPLREICELDPVPVTSRRHDKVFLRLLCWTGDSDADGANFYIPVKTAQ